MRVEFPKVELSVSAKKTRKKIKGGEKEYRYYVFSKMIPVDNIHDIMSLWSLSSSIESEKWFGIPESMVKLFETIMYELARDLASKRVVLDLSDKNKLSKIINKLGIAASVIVSSALASGATSGAIDILADYAILGIDIGMDTEVLVKELVPLREKIKELLASNPVTKNFKSLVQSTEVGNVLIAISQLGTYLVKTYLMVEIEGDKLIVAPIALKITDFAGLRTYLSIIIEEEKARAATD